MMSFAEYVENRAAQAPADRFTAGAVGSFLGSARRQRAAAPTEPALATWCVDMTLADLRPATRLKYFRRIHSLYREWKTAPGADPFDAVRPIVDGDFAAANARAAANLACVGRLLAVGPASPSFTAVAVFLYLLYDPRATLDDVISLRFTDPVADLPQLADIIDAMRRSGRTKRVFGLGQGKKRQPQIARDLLTTLHAALCPFGFDFGAKLTRESITAIWIAAALRDRVPAADIRAIVPAAPEGYAWLHALPAAPIHPFRCERILQRVADTINDASPRWFIMKLRSGRTPDDVRRAIDTHFPGLTDDILFYYPTRPVVRLGRRGRKLTEQVPYLPGILFFRMRRDKVAPIFARIGDLAWCYRRDLTPDSPYCTISPAEMRVFQRHVGSFTPDIRMELVSRPLAPGDRAVISGGGMMEGLTGVITAVNNADGTRTYSLSLSSTDFATWTVHSIDEACLEPLLSANEEL